VSDLDAWLDDYRPYVSTVKVCGRADLVAEHERLNADLIAAVAADKDMLASERVAAAKATVKAVEAEIEASERTFTFQGLGQREWQDLKRQHPPTEEQRERGHDSNMETYAPALIAATSLDPKISVEQATRLLERLPIAEAEKLYEAALNANGQVAGPPKSVLAAHIDQVRLNGASSTTALPEGFLGASSSDDGDEASTG
jgi:hypothetical protein